MKIRLANPRGFCAGVDRAIDIVNRALDVFEPPIYVRHEVVHNKFVVENLKIVVPFLSRSFIRYRMILLLFSVHMVSRKRSKQRLGVEV